MTTPKEPTRITEGTPLVSVSIDEIRKKIDDSLNRGSWGGCQNDIIDCLQLLNTLTKELNQLYADECFVWRSTGISNGARSFNFGRLSLLEDLLGIPKKKD